MNFERLQNIDTVCDVKDYFFYLQKKIVVILNDNTIKSGKLLDVSDGELCLDTDDVIDYSDVKNLFYYGEITSYKKRKQVGVINLDEVGFVKEEAMVDDVLFYVFYDEYHCVVAGHLYQNEEDSQRYYLKDIVKLSVKPKGDYKNYQGMRVEVRKVDGQVVYGRITEVTDKNIEIRVDKQRQEILLKDIECICKDVDLLDEVCITTLEGEQYCGKVVSISEKDHEIELEKQMKIAFDTIKTIEYITHNVKTISAKEGKFSDKYVYRTSYFANKSYDYLISHYKKFVEALNGEDITVYFKVGLSAKGFIAKEIRMDMNEEDEGVADTKLGVVVHYSPKVAYIGPKFEEFGHENTGNTIFFPQGYGKLDFRYNYEYLYVVEYTEFDVILDPKTNKANYTVDTDLGIRVVEKFLRGIYKKIEVVNGEIIKTPFDDDYYLSGQIEQISGQTGIIRGDDGIEYEFLTESIINPQPIMLAKNSYKVHFIPAQVSNIISNLVSRARGVKIVEVQSLYKTVQPVTEQNVEKKNVLNMQDKKKLYKLFIERFGVSQSYVMPQVSEVLNSNGYTKEKYGPHLEILNNLSEFATVQRESATLVRIKFRKNDKFNDGTVSFINLQEEDKERLYWIMKSNFGVGQKEAMSRVSLVLNRYGYGKKQIGGSHSDLVKSLYEFVEVYVERPNMFISIKECERYEKNKLFVNLETGIDELELERDADNGYEYGLINTCGTKYFKICMKYINRLYVTAPEEESSDEIIVPTQDANIDFKLETSKYSYLVKFVRGEKIINEEGVEIQLVNSEYPIELVRVIQKKVYAQLEVKENKLMLSKISLIQDEKNIDDISNIEITDKHLMLLNGENYFQANQDGSVNFKTHASSDGEVSVEMLKSLNEKIKQIYRIGVITSWDMSKQIGYINGMIPFDMSVVEAKTLNIIKTYKGHEKGSIHVIYCCEKNRVMEVLRIPAEYLETIQWEEQKVVSCDDARKQVLLENDEFGKPIFHNLSVSSDGWVCKLFKQKELTDKEVFVKNAMHPMLNDNEIELVTSAVEIHCKYEMATIQYDVIKNLFFAFRNATYSCPIIGDEKKLATLDGEVVEVEFAVNKAGTGLRAYTEQGGAYETEPDILVEDDEDMEEVGRNRIEESTLVRFHMKNISVRQMVMPLDVDVDEDGYPYKADVERVVRMLYKGEFKKYIAAAMVMKKRGINRVLIGKGYKGRENYTRSINQLITEALFKNVDAIMVDPNGNYAEYSYYISSLLNHGNRKIEKLCYYLFVQDFVSRPEVPLEVNRDEITDDELQDLFLKECINVASLLSHIMLLDENNFSSIMSLISYNQELEISLKNYICENFSDRLGEVCQELSAEVLCSKLRILYKNEKKRLVELVFNKNRQSVFECAKTGIEAAKMFFLKLICADDKRCFEELEQYIWKYNEFQKEDNFSRKADGYHEIIRQLSVLKEEIIAHPTKEAFEVLLEKTEIIDRLISGVKEELDVLYKGSIPNITCKLNDADVRKETKSIFLVLENSNNEISQASILQTANNIKLEVKSQTEGFGVKNNPFLGYTSIRSNEKVYATVTIDLTELEDDIRVLSLEYTLSYDYFDGYEKLSHGKLEGILTLQISIMDENTVVKGKENPYTRYRGQAVVYGDKFYGRDKEITGIMEHLVDSKKNTLISGRTLILYGQKKCGKTSLINQVVGRIQEIPNTICIRFSDVMCQIVTEDMLGSFNLCLYSSILVEFEDKISKMPEVQQLLKEHKMDISQVLDNELTASIKFYKFFDRFREIDGGKHPVIIIMDEFTAFCAALKSRPELHRLPGFIKTFAEHGFVQIYIGHESMIRILGQLGVLNATAEFAKKIELSALDAPSARRLIREPMLETYGVDVYNTPLGEAAIERLLDLSGRSPSFLSKLCEEVFDYYDGISKKYIYKQDIEQVAKSYVDTLNIADFDALLSENGDKDISVEESDTYKYLKKVALESRYVPTMDCSSDILCEELEAIEDGLSIQTRDLLNSRRVISIQNGRVKINVGLFRELIYKRG